MIIDSRQFAVLEISASLVIYVKYTFRVHLEVVLNEAPIDSCQTVTYVSAYDSYSRMDS